MLGADLRLLALACLMMTPAALAQNGSAIPFEFSEDAGRLYEENQGDVTIPVASYAQDGGNGTDSVSVPTENLATPMRCMTAWSYLAGRAIEASDLMRGLHPDFTEATASAHWQHWLHADLAASQGVLSADFHQRRLAAERAFSLALAQQEEAYAFRTLGTCYVTPTARQVGDATQLLRNFMIEYQGLPESYAVPALQRQLRAFPISETIEADGTDDCDDDQAELLTAVSDQVKLQCFDRGGILASQIKTTLDQPDGLCRAAATVQCENIP